MIQIYIIDIQHIMCFSELTILLQKFLKVLSSSDDDSLSEHYFLNSSMSFKNSKAFLVFVPERNPMVFLTHLICRFLQLNFLKSLKGQDDTVLIKTLYKLEDDKLKVLDMYNDLDMEIKAIDYAFSKDFKAYMSNRFKSKNTPAIHLRS